MVIHKTFADFVLFLYVHMAYADGFFHPSERETIHGKLSKLYPEATDYAERINATEKEYLSHDKDAVADIIKDTFRHFSSVKFALKYKVYTDMFDIIHADGKVEVSETKALEELKRIIDVSVEKDSAASTEE
jgi:uncharacterized tellurite resistance protein B-like protein